MKVPRHMQTRDILSLEGNDVIDVVFITSQEFTFFGVCVDEFDLVVMLLCEPVWGCVEFRSVVFHPLGIAEGPIIFLILGVLLVKKVSIFAAILSLSAQFCFFGNSPVVLIFSASLALRPRLTVPLVEILKRFLKPTRRASFHRDKPFALV